MRDHDEIVLRFNAPVLLQPRYNGVIDLSQAPKSKIEQFRASPLGTSGRAFLSSRRPVGNLVKRRSRRLG